MRRRSPKTVALLGEAHRSQVERRKDAAARLCIDDTARERIESAPPAYVLVHGVTDIARHAGLLSPVPAAREVRVAVTPSSRAGEWRLDVAGRDRAGLLAAFTGALAAQEIDVIQAVLATWDDSAALQAFVVRSAVEPMARDLEARFAASLSSPLSSPAIEAAEIVFDGDVSPLYTACAVRAPDRPGLLHAVAVGISVAGGDVHAARVTTVDGMAHDRFDLSDRAGHKLSEEAKTSICAVIRSGWCLS